MSLVIRVSLLLIMFMASSLPNASPITTSFVLNKDSQQEANRGTHYLNSLRQEKNPLKHLLQNSYEKETFPSITLQQHSFTQNKKENTLQAVTFESIQLNSIEGLVLHGFDQHELISDFTNDKLTVDSFIISADTSEIQQAAGKQPSIETLNIFRSATTEVLSILDRSAMGLNVEKIDKKIRKKKDITDSTTQNIQLEFKNNTDNTTNNSNQKNSAFLENRRSTFLGNTPGFMSLNDTTREQNIKETNSQDEQQHSRAMKYILLGIEFIFTWEFWLILLTFICLIEIFRPKSSTNQR